MADEPAQTDAPVVEPVAQEQAPVVNQDPAPVGETPSAPETPVEPDRGDPRVAMQEERRRRQDLEARLNDPQFIYENAKRLGLAEADTPTAPPPPETFPHQFPQGPDVGAIVAHQLDFRETIKAHPEFDPQKGDKALVKWAAALVDDGHKPSEAVDIIIKTIDKRISGGVQTAVNERLDAKATSEAQKLNADAISSTVTASSDALEIEELNTAAKDWKNPARQEKAILEKLKRGIK